jgi:release factor glutamine methyltransferase
MTRPKNFKTFSSCQEVRTIAHPGDGSGVERQGEATVKVLMARVSAELQRVGIEEYALEARLLLGSCLKMTRTELFLRGEEAPTPAEQELLHIWLQRRTQREPLAYIVGEQEFWSKSFKVSPAVLIPRPETEFLLDRVLALCQPENVKRGAILDLCCGSGVIATVLAMETGQPVFAVDLSLAALQVASANLIRHQVIDRVNLVCGNLFTPFATDRRFSLIVTNPPYVGCQELACSVEPEVARYEPRLALDGGNDGLAIIRNICSQAPHYLRPGGELFMEIGADQGQEVAAMFSSKSRDIPGFSRVAVYVDYAGRDRVLHATLAN